MQMKSKIKIIIPSSAEHQHQKSNLAKVSIIYYFEQLLRMKKEDLSIRVLRNLNQGYI